MDAKAVSSNHALTTPSAPSLPDRVNGADTGDLGRLLSPDRDAGSAPPPGEAFGSYELLGEVARGGMGVVYKARQRGLDRVVALKMVLGADLGQSSAVVRFLVEARAAAALDHPNVVPVYDAGEVDGRVYFTMAFVDGPDLRRYVEGRGVPPLATALRLFLAACSGVAHAHQHGIVHRDLKPANVLIDRDGRPRVTDFGLAKRSSRDTQITGTGQIMGTPAYMAPEQARESKDVGPAADVYALGGVLYFLLTGRPPFEATSIADLLLLVMTQPPVPPRTRIPTVPPEIEAICLRCLAKEPGDRYADAQVLHDEIAALAEPYLSRASSGLRPPIAVPEPASATAPTPATISVPPVAPPEPPHRSRVLGVVTGLAAVVVVAALAILRPWSPTPAGSPSLPAVESAWAIPAKGDFGLSVRLQTTGRPGPDGSLVLPAGVGTMRLRLRADENCSAAVFCVDADGKQITQLFPNVDDPDGRLTAGVERLIPPTGANQYTIDSSPTNGNGVEHLWVIARAGDLPPLPAGQQVGRFRQFTSDADRRQVEEARRGLSIGVKRPDGPRAADAEIAFRVTPR